VVGLILTYKIGIPTISGVSFFYFFEIFIMKITDYKVSGSTLMAILSKNYPLPFGNKFTLSYYVDGVADNKSVSNMNLENFEYLLAAGELPNELECDLVNDLLIITDHHIIDNFNGFLKTN
jgi:hypothetical protein